MKLDFKRKLYPMDAVIGSVLVLLAGLIVTLVVGHPWQAEIDGFKAEARVVGQPIPAADDRLDAGSATRLPVPEDERRHCVLMVMTGEDNRPYFRTCERLYEMTEGNDFWIVGGNLQWPSEPVWIKVCGPYVRMEGLINELLD